MGRAAVLVFFNVFLHPASRVSIIPAYGRIIGSSWSPLLGSLFSFSSVLFSSIHSSLSHISCLNLLNVRRLYPLSAMDLNRSSPAKSYSKLLLQIRAKRMNCDFITPL